MFSSSKQLEIASHFLLSWREVRILNKTKFVLSLLSSLIVLLALGPHDEPLQFDCIAIRLLNFLTPFEGKCILFFIVVSTLRRLLPRSVLGNLFGCLCTTGEALGRNQSGSRPSSVDRRALRGNPTSSHFGNRSKLTVFWSHIV